jgi:hypothetical protein
LTGRIGTEKKNEAMGTQNVRIGRRSI